MITINCTNLALRWHLRIKGIFYEWPTRLLIDNELNGPYIANFLIIGLVSVARDLYSNKCHNPAPIRIQQY